jgi:hypothetical protein
MWERIPFLHLVKREKQGCRPPATPLLRGTWPMLPQSALLHTLNSQTFLLFFNFVLCRPEVLQSLKPAAGKGENLTENGGGDSR